MAPENRETMQKGLEASLGCFQAKSFFYGPHCPRTFNGQQTLDVKYTINGKQANTDSENPEKLSTRPKTYYVWPVHIQSHPLDGSHIYPGNRGSYIQTQWVPQVPIHMVPQSYSPDYLYQDFHYFVVIDFEATCDKDKNPHPQEIIEFPSVIVNTRTGQLEDWFQIYVRPSHNQNLSEFCKELTGIQQSQVDKGVLLSEALLMHDKWLEEKGIKKTSFAVVTWSNWDCKVMLESECRFKRIRKPPYFNRWINLKIPFNNLFGFARRNLKEAVELAGLTWEGRAHCGLDDAKNTARLLAHLMYRGFKFSITNSLQWQSADHPTTPYQNPPQILSPKNQIPTPENNLAYQTHKWKASPFTYIPFLPFQEPPVYCLCGAQSIKRVSQKAGPHRGCSFFGCGNWTANRGPVCSFFKWVAVEPVSEPGKPV